MNKILESFVSIVTGYWLEGQDSIPDIAMLLLLSTASRQTLLLTQPCVQWV
jgi:hypothetical protein